MSSSKVIFEVSKLPRQTLWEGFSSDSALTPQHVPNLQSIVLMNPADTAREQNRRLWKKIAQYNVPPPKTT